MLGRRVKEGEADRGMAEEEGERRKGEGRGGEEGFRLWHLDRLNRIFGESAL